MFSLSPAFWPMIMVTAVAFGTSGGEQYIHRESMDRQQLLHQCFRQSSNDALAMSGILEAAAQKHPEEDAPHRVLEIGCGAGHTTLDLLLDVLPEHFDITAVDTDASMITAAKSRQKKSKDNRVTFLHQTGESLAQEMPGQFDAVWIRFVVVHVPDPVALLRAAVACLKRGGILLVEDTYTPGASSLCDPPFYAHSFFHEMHAVATRKLGGDLTRGAKIGTLMRDLGLEDIRCNSFAPIFGRGVQVQPWTSTTSPTSCLEKYPLSKFDAGWNLLELSLASLIPKLRDLKVCTEEELTRAQESIVAVKETIDATPHCHQIFSLPDGTIFQWWGTKQH